MSKVKSFATEEQLLDARRQLPFVDIVHHTTPHDRAPLPAEKARNLHFVECAIGHFCDRADVPARIRPLLERIARYGDLGAGPTFLANAFPSQTTLARDLGCSVDTIARRIKEAAATGVLAVGKRSLPGHHNTYRLDAELLGLGYLKSAGCDTTLEDRDASSDFNPWGVVIYKDTLPVLEACIISSHEDEPEKQVELIRSVSASAVERQGADFQYDNPEHQEVSDAVSYALTRLMAQYPSFRADDVSPGSLSRALQRAANRQRASDWDVMDALSVMLTRYERQEIRSPVGLFESVLRDPHQPRTGRQWSDEERSYFMGRMDYYRLEWGADGWRPAWWYMSSDERREWLGLPHREADENRYDEGDDGEEYLTEFERDVEARARAYRLGFPSLSIP